jgi:hypothetical protein
LRESRGLAKRGKMRAIGRISTKISPSPAVDGVRKLEVEREFDSDV